MDKLEVTGGIGIAPPPGADMTPSQPLQPDAGTIIDLEGVAQRPIDKARENERELAPLKPAGAPGSAGAVQAANGSVQTPREVVAAGPAPSQRGANRPPDASRPAASAEEDPVEAGPSRGMPGTAYSSHRNPKLQRLEVGAGFGGPGEYFALDGTEVAETIRQMLGELDQHLNTDLRFSVAAAYPRYSITLTARVEAEAGDQSFDITLIRGKEKEPEEVAMQHCDKVVFVVMRQRREFDDVGEVETPPDALREELGLVVPGRRVVSTGKFGPLMADLPLGF
jgi:hypothetical protein